MALTDEQIEILEDAIVPLFSWLEQEVIRDVARRIKKTMTYTRTAELQAMSMRELGYSPAKIRKEAMKLLNADSKYRKEVAKNTLEYKKEIKKLIEEIVKQAKLANDDIIGSAGNMAWIDDLNVWKDNGITLTDNSFLSGIVDAYKAQTGDLLKNLTNTTGFQSISGFEPIKTLYRTELDKAIIKITTGTFDRETVLKDIVHNLAQSGIRSIDYASGRTYQLDTAARMAIRTGCNQLAAKVSDKNMENTGVNLVYVSKHWGARNKGTGHANHEEWQGKVYYFGEYKQEYDNEAERIGQEKIDYLWEATGYSADGKHENDIVGLHGVNCRHRHHPWFIGASTIPKETPEPDPIIYNGKKYDYYAVTQKMRAMERGIRSLKRERDALKYLGLDEKEINTKIRKKTREYHDFCEYANVNPQPARLRYESGTADLKKTESWNKYKAAASDAVRNTRTNVHFNPEYDYSISIEEYPAMVNKGLSDAARDVAEKGEKDRCEHMHLVDLETGNLEYYETNGEPSEVGYNFWDYLKEHPERKYAFVHNHNTDSMFSQTDIQTLLTTEQVPVMIAVRNDAIKYIAERKGDSISNLDLYSEYNDDIETLNMEHRNGIITAGERAIKLEQTIVYNALRDFTLGGKLIEQNGQRK